MVNPAGQPRFPRHRNRTIVPKLIVLAGKDLMPDIFRFKSVRSRTRGRWKEDILFDRPSRTNSIESVVKKV